MKYILLLGLFLSSSLLLNAQDDAISKYFDQYVEDERFTVVYISQKMFGLISKLTIEDIEEDEDAKIAMDMISDLKGLRVLTTDTLTNQFYKEAMRKINTDEYEVLMTVRDGNENVRFWVKETGNTIKELLLLVGGDDSFVMLSFVGDIDLDKISKLSNSIDVKGAEHLDKIKSEE